MDQNVCCADASLDSYKRWCDGVNGFAFIILWFVWRNEWERRRLRLKQHIVISKMRWFEVVESSKIGYMYNWILDDMWVLFWFRKILPIKLWDGGNEVELNSLLQTNSIEFFQLFICKWCFFNVTILNSNTTKTIIFIYTKLVVLESWGLILYC